MLKRELSKIDGYATIIGMMVGSGIFVAIGEAGQFAGPSTVLAYILLGPVTLLIAMPYVIFQSTPLGNLVGGAYIHISRTFKTHYVAFIVMWLSWLTYVGVLSVLSLSVGRYLEAIWPGLDPQVTATVCIVFFYLINLTGVRQFGRIQSAMFFVLIVSLLIIIVPGLFYAKAANFTPFLPNGFSGFLKALPILFFAYAGFDCLSQTAGETKNAARSLPRIFVVGICVTIAIYVGMSVVAFGTYPYDLLFQSKAPLVGAVRTYLPFGGAIVTVGALMAFLTTINACMMVPSRILYAFAEDRVAPRALSKLNDRFSTPHLSLTINAVIAIALIWTRSIGYLISISIQATIILYVAECVAMASLPLVNKELWEQVPYRISGKWLTVCGIVGAAALVVLYIHIPNPIPVPLIIWTVVGTAFYFFERRQGRKDNFDYTANLSMFPNNDTNSSCLLVTGEGNS